jgi:hypothetical protein
MPSLACPVLDSYGADVVDRMRGPYVSQYASRSLAQRGRLIAPVSQRLTFGCEAVAIANSVRRIWAHAPMSCPAYSRATWNRSRWASPQATSTSGCPDTTIVCHTHIQGVYASHSYYTYMTYISVGDHAVCGLPRQQSTGPWRHTDARAPPEEQPVRYQHPGPHADLDVADAPPELHISASNPRVVNRAGAPTTPARLNRVEGVQAGPSQNNCSEVSWSRRPQAPGVSTGRYPYLSWLWKSRYSQSSLGRHSIIHS